MKTWIVSSLDEETVQGEETIQGRKLYEEIRYVRFATKKVQVDRYTKLKKRGCKNGPVHTAYSFMHFQCPIENILNCNLCDQSRLVLV